MTDTQAESLWEALCTLRELDRDDLADLLVPLIEAYRAELKMAGYR